jgi:hypothetical protein
MKQVTLGVYCNAHFDFPVMVPDDLDISKMTKGSVNSLIALGKITFKDETTKDLMDGMDVHESAVELFETSNGCGSFRLSKINYLLDDEQTNFLKK